MTRRGGREGGNQGTRGEGDHRQVFNLDSILDGSTNDFWLGSQIVGHLIDDHYWRPANGIKLGSILLCMMRSEDGSTNLQLRDDN
jgi:hypothetical protein